MVLEEVFQNSKLFPKLPSPKNSSTSPKLYSQYLVHPENSPVSTKLVSQNFSNPGNSQSAQVSPIRTKRTKKPRGKIAMLLTIPFKFANGKCKELEFLVDTGSEMNLIQKKYVPEISWMKAPQK